MTGRRFLTGLSAALLLGAVTAHAGDDGHDRARRAVQSGTILPLRVILERVENDHDGQMIEAELEDEDGRLVYEIKLVTADGRVLKVHYDARSGEPVKERQ